MVTLFINNGYSLVGGRGNEKNSIAAGGSGQMMFTSRLGKSVRFDSQVERIRDNEKTAPWRVEPGVSLGRTVLD